MKMFRTVRSVIVIVLAGHALGACGVKSSPQHPADSRYPKHYPAAKNSAPFITSDEKQVKPPQRRSGPATGIYQYPNPSHYVPPEN